MITHWTVSIYNLTTLMVFLVAIIAAARISWKLGLRSRKVNEVFKRAFETPSLRSAVPTFREIPPNSPEYGLAQMCALAEADQDTIFLVLEKAEIEFWRRMGQIESWVGASRYATVVLALATIAFSLCSLQHLAYGLAIEMEHDAAAILDLVQDVLHVMLVGTFGISFLLALNMVTTTLIQRRKDRWNIFFNQLRRRAAREDYKRAES